MATVIDELEIKVSSNGLDGLLKALDRLENKFIGARGAAGDFAKATEKIGKSASAAGKSAEKASGGMGKFVASLGRIAKYRFLRTMLREAGQAFKEGLDNAYNFSKSIGGDLASAMDSLSVKTLTMKNQMGAAWGALLTSLTPIILQLISLITRLANAITQLIRALSGNSTYLRAVDSTAALSQNLGSGAKAAKELRRQLMGFDEINRLDAPSNGGGGGGLADEDLWRNMFEETAISGYIAKIKEWLDSLDTSKLKEAWAGFKETLVDVGKVLVGEMGETIKAYVENFLPVGIDLLSAILNLIKGIWEWLEPLVEELNGFMFDSFLEGLSNLKDLLNDISELTGGEKGLPEFLYDLSTKLPSVAEAFNPALLAGKYFGNLFGEEIASIIQTTKNDIADFVESASIAWDNFKLSLEDLKQKIMGVWDSIRNWWNTNVAKYFTKEFWQEKINNMFAVTPPHIPLPHFEWGAIPASGVLAQALTFLGLPAAIPTLNIAWYAQGGFPEDGLFMANHGELVGKFSNGNTAVANNEQIIAGIEKGVFSAMTAALANSDSGERTINLYLDGKQISSAVTRGQRQLSRATGVAYG